MRTREVISSLTFRYMARYVTVLTAAVFLLMGVFYGYFTYNYFGRLSESIVEELDTLEIVYAGQSIAGVEQYVADQQRVPAVERFYYLVTDARGEKIAGDLVADSRYREFSGGWLSFQLALLEWGESVGVEFLARPRALSDEYQAIVARNYADSVERARLVFRTLFRAMSATFLLGIVGGYFAAASTLNQVEKLNNELSRIIRANPHQRLKVGSEKGYVRELAMMMNKMLDQMENLMQGVRMVSDNIAHDLRTPLTHMRNNLSQLRTKLKHSEQQDLDSIVAECDELLTSFNALLRISALESGSRLSEGVEVDLKELLQDLVELYEPVAAEKDLRLELLALDRQTCQGDIDLLFQMFANLLDNAIKYTPSGGSVEVRLSKLPAVLSELHGIDESHHSIVISDSGPGISVHDRKNVFRRFYRVEESRSQQPGHGLGLSLVQAIAHYHYGSIELSNNNPGLRVRIKLP